MGAVSSSRYHHGDLRSTLLREATAMIRRGGIEALTLRRLAARARVTPPALYHHFRDKNDLLCALAERGFSDLEARITLGPADGAGQLEEVISGFVHAYVGYAAAHPERYELMFGRTIWKAGRPTDSLRAVAFATFRRYVESVQALVARTSEAERPNALRVAQASWAMLHGLCRLRIDGIYVDAGDLDAMADEAVRFLLGRLEPRAPARRR